MVEFTARHPDVVRFFEKVYVPDEMFFQTVLVPRSTRLQNDDLHYIDWARKGKVLLASDLPALRAAPQLFARKLDRRVDAELADLIDRDLLAETPKS